MKIFHSFKKLIVFLTLIGFAAYSPIIVWANTTTCKPPSCKDKRNALEGACNGLDNIEVQIRKTKLELLLLLPKNKRKLANELDRATKKFQKAWRAYAVDKTNKAKKKIFDNAHRKFEEAEQKYNNALESTGKKIAANLLSDQLNQLYFHLPEWKQFKKNKKKALNECLKKL